MSRCDECRFWDRGIDINSSEDEAPGDFGICHRYPPVLVSCLGKTHPNDYWFTQDDYDHPMSGESDWCGEFQPKPDPDEKLR